MTTFPIPNAALDDRLAVVGTAGSGKTYLVLGAIEHLLARKSRVIGVDPLGVMWGLRLCADGQTPSPFQPVIFGGAHGDLPLNEHAGALVGETVATMRESCIIDLSSLGTKNAERRFMLAFLTALYRATDKEPVHLIIDEADMFAPQKLLDKEGDAAKLLGMMETVVRRGRVKGFIPWLITQRPAVLSKDVLSQADGLVGLKLTASQDRKALGGWVESTADAGQWKAIDSALPAFQRGEGVVWIPARGIIETVSFPTRATFDSSRTPKRGEKRESRELKPLNIDALKDKLATIADETKANDPKALKAEIARLTAALRKAELIKPEKSNATELVAAREEGWANGHEKGLADGLRAGCHIGLDVIAVVEQNLAGEMHAARKLIDTKRGELAPPKPPAQVARAPKRLPFNEVAPPDRPKPAPRVNGEPLSGPARRVMEAIGFWASVGNEQPTREQVAGIAGYKPSTGNFRAVVGALSTSGELRIPSPGRLTADGPVTAFTLSPAEARDRLRNSIDAPALKVLDEALMAGQALGRDRLAQASGYDPSTGNFRAIVGSLCTLDILRKPAPGMVEVSVWAREVLA